MTSNVPPSPVLRRTSRVYDPAVWGWFPAVWVSRVPLWWLPRSIVCVSPVAGRQHQRLAEPDTRPWSPRHEVGEFLTQLLDACNQQRAAMLEMRPAMRERKAEIRERRLVTTEPGANVGPTRGE